MTTQSSGSLTHGVSANNSDAKSPTRADILLVDDQPARLLTYEAVLAGLEVRCVRAHSGNEALQHLLDQEFAVILLDVHMPGMDGFQLAKMIREHPRLERTPIIFVTGVHVSEFDRLRGYEVGAIDYISVPIVPEILRSKVAVLVELHLKRRELEGLNRELHEMRSRVESEHQRILASKESELTAERRRTTAALRAGDRYNRVLIEHAPVAIGHCSLEGRLLSVNKAFCDLVGYTAEELATRRWQDITHPDDVALDSQLALRVINGEIPHYTIQKRYVRKDGRVVWVKLYGNVLRDEAERPVQGVVIAIDITDQITSTQALRESEQRLVLAKAGARLGIFDWNLLTGALTWDDRLHELWGTHPGDGIDRETFERGIHPDDREFTLASMNRAMRADSDGHYSCVHRVVNRRRESIRWVEVSGRVSFDGKRPVRFNGVVQDVTERKDAEARLHLIADQLPALISYVGSDGRYEFCNAAYCEWFGRSKEQIVGQHTSAVLGVAAFEERRHLIERAMAGELITFESRVPHRRLGMRQCDTVYIPHRLSDGRVNGVYVMAHDVTERKASENRVRESEKRFRNMADNSPVMIWMTEPDGSCSYLNERWYELTGQTRQNSGTRNWLAAVHEEDAPRIYNDFMRANAAQAPLRLEYRLRDSSGRYRWVLDTASPRFSDDGTFAGYIGSVIDISERKVMEEALRESEARFRELADAMPQIVFTARPDGVTEYFNRQWYEMTGLPPGSTEDGIWSRSLHPDDRERTLDTWYRAVQTGQPYQIEYRFNFPDQGGFRWHLARALPVRNSAGDVVRWYGTCTDIHDLRLAQDALKDADRRKDEFIATLAHELRNPLAPIRSAIHFLQLQSPPDDRLGHARAMIERQAQVMVRLVDDLLDLSRVTRGRITLQLAPFDLVQALTDAMETSRTIIEANKHQLAVSLPQEPVLIHGDSTRLSQIFSNLLHNAAKYTPAGGRIDLSMTHSGGEAVVSIRDDGIGIPLDMLEAIFEMFAQVAPTPDRSHGGLGIGLTLARQLAALHGGRIEAHSAGLGRGSEFRVTLPVMHVANDSPSASTIEKPATTRRRVLIADDNVDAAQSLSFLLELCGHEVRMASNGPEALKEFARYKPEIVLLDIGMPGMSGHEVATSIRSLPDGKSVVLVAVSGWGQESDRRASFAAGFDQHLTKPVGLESIEALLQVEQNREFDRSGH